MVHFEAQRAEGEPGWRELRLTRGQLFELRGRFGVALRSRKVVNIEQAQAVSVGFGFRGNR